MLKLLLNAYCSIRARLMNAPKHLTTWFVIDVIYISVIVLFLGRGIHLTLSQFFLVHMLGIAVGTMVMFTGLGAGVLWIPILTFLNLKPSEAVSISIFTQIAGKGMGSLTYLFAGMVDLEVAKQFIPMALIGAGLGYLSAFVISMDYERLLLYIFVLIAAYLLVRMIQSLNVPVEESTHVPEARDIRKSYPVVILSSFFTGLLSIGNTDWLIPHMEHYLRMSPPRAVATGLFIMFVTLLFYLAMVWVSVWFGYRTWPPGTSVLFATCSGVIVGGQIGTRLIRYPWFRQRQKHAFILLLALSIIHLLW